MSEETTVAAQGTEQAAQAAPETAPVDTTAPEPEKKDEIAELKEQLETARRDIEYTRTQLTQESQRRAEVERALAAAAVPQPTDGKSIAELILEDPKKADELLRKQLGAVEARARAAETRALITEIRSEFKEEYPALRKHEDLVGTEMQKILAARKTTDPHQAMREAAKTVQKMLDDIRAAERENVTKAANAKAAELRKAAVETGGAPKASAPTQENETPDDFVRARRERLRKMRGF